MNAILQISRRLWAHAAIAVMLLASGQNIVSAQTIFSPAREPEQKQERPTPVLAAQRGVRPAQFHFVFEPDTPLKDLLPAPPTAKTQRPSAFVDNLADVTEVMLAEPLPTSTTQVKAVALQIAKIDHLNKESSDRFLELLVAERPDLADLPFQMREQCHLSSLRSRHFKRAVAMVQGARGRSENGESFLTRFQDNCAALDDLTTPSLVREHWEHAVPARVAAITQICGPMSDSMKLAMAKYLATVSTVESTQALVNTILFAPEQHVRDAAIAALKTRRQSDWTDALLRGFHYPWPDVATRTAEALVKLDRMDLVPKIIDVLDEADPRAPFVDQRNGKAVKAVRELVRINHHRNCLMCHAPGGSEAGNKDVLTARVAVPGESFGDLEYYQSPATEDILVRIDTTYLRQDFSIMLPVEQSGPWPRMQRFDFVVRTRVLTDGETKAYAEKFVNRASSKLPPNHLAALFALHVLTGKDAAPTADAWRKIMSGTKQ